MQTKTESTYLIHHLIPSKNLEILFGAKYNVSVFVTMNMVRCAAFIDVFQKKSMFMQISFSSHFTQQEFRNFTKGNKAQRENKINLRVSESNDYCL